MSNSLKRNPIKEKTVKGVSSAEKKGHFSKNCPNKKEKASKLIHSLDLVENEDIES